MLRRLKHYRFAILNAIIAVLIFLVIAEVYRRYFDPYAYPGLAERALFVLGALFIIFLVMYVNIGKIRRKIEVEALVHRKQRGLIHQLISNALSEKGYVALLALVGMVYVFIRIREIGFISYIITALSGLLVIVTSMIVLGDDDEK